jgi:hypothetical protein
VTYVFVFLGEFGYELFNWQGVVRKAREQLPHERVICASRGLVAPLYDDAEYVDIGDVEAFRKSVASAYFAILPDLSAFGDRRARQFDRRLRRELEREIRRRAGLTSHGLRRDVRFVFSSDTTQLGGCRFGARWDDFGAAAGIYESLDLSNNRYARVEAVLGCRGALEERLGLSLDDRFVLVQSRYRDIAVRSQAKIASSEIVRTLAERFPVVYVEFASGRARDSYSSSSDLPGVRRIAVDGFPEQSCLIHFASRCVFLTEGDFGSHIYVPPFLGRDVIAIAPADVYTIGTTPLAFWNESVFRFGGQILPVVAETLEDVLAREEWANSVAAGVPG